MADLPRPPTPEELSTLARLKAEMQKIAEQNARISGGVANAERIAGKPVVLPMDRKSDGGQPDVEQFSHLYEAPEQTMAERIGDVLKAGAQRGLEAAFPLRKIGRVGIEQELKRQDAMRAQDPLAWQKSMRAEQAAADRGYGYMENAVRKTLGMKPVWFNKGRITPVEMSEEELYKKASGGQVSQDAMQLALMNKNTPVAKEIPANKRMIEAVYNQYPVHPFNPNQRAMVEGEGEDQTLGTFELKPSMSARNAVELDWLSAYPHKQGVGSRTLKALQGHAAEHGVGLTLFPWEHGGVSQSKLIKFYKKHGFVPTTKGGKAMIWRPEIEEKAQGGNVSKNPFDYQNPEHTHNVAGHLMHHKEFNTGPDAQKHMSEVLSTGNYRYIEDPRIQNAIRKAGHDSYFTQEKTGKHSHVMKKASGGNVQLSVEQMRQQLMNAGKPLQDISQIGAQEAPSMPVKSFVIPNNGAQGPLPMGGVDMSPSEPGQQMLPANAMQPNPLMPQQPQQPAAPAPQGGGSNILQMTPQGQKMAALAGSPQGNLPQPPQMATGGPVPGPQPVHNHPFQAAAQKPLPFMAKVGGSDNMPMDNQSMDNGATTFNIDNIQELAKGGQAKKPLHYAPAPALSKAQIEAMAERMARQISGLDNPNAKTLQQLAREQNLPVGIKSSKKMDVPVINFEDLKDSYSVGVPGDTSRGGVKPSRRSSMAPVKAGEYLHSIGNEKLESPVPLYGGYEYGAFGHPEGWASDLGASAGMFNVVKKLAEENPEREVYGHYHKMSPEALNHALHMLDTVLSYHKPHAAPAERIAMLNDLMRNQTTTTSKHDVPYPEFPGFENPQDIMLQGALNSGMRKKIIGMLGKEKHFPGGKQKLDDIIYAISHPELRNIETGAGGSSVIKFDPSRELRESVSPHPTYGHDIPSRLVGKTKYITPAEILAPRSMANAVREIKAMGKKVVPFNQAKMNIIREPIDQQYIDQMGQYEHAMKKRLGYKKGGKVKLSNNMDTINLELSKSRKKAK